MFKKLIIFFFINKTVSFIIPQKKKLISLHASKIDELDLSEGPEGLMYLDRLIGTGPSPSKFDELEVHYKGWYYDPVSDESIKFDDSRKRDKKKGLLFEYGTSPIIKGWIYGLQTMKQGGKRTIIVPPILGYGDEEVHSKGRPSIPKNSELRFDIELINVNNNIIRKIRRFLYQLLRPYS